MGIKPLFYRYGLYYRQADFTDEKFNPPVADIHFFYRPNQDEKQNQIAISKLEAISKMKSFRILAVDLSESKLITDKFKWLRHKGSLKTQSFGHKIEVFESSRSVE